MYVVCVSDDISLYPLIASKMMLYCMCCATVVLNTVKHNGPDSSMHCDSRKHMQIDKTPASIFVYLTTHTQHLENTPQIQTTHYRNTQQSYQKRQRKCFQRTLKSDKHIRTRSFSFFVCLLFFLLSLWFLTQS